MFEAAMLGEELSHTGAMNGFMAGALLGAALVTTVAVTTVTCGFGAALLAGLAAGVGGSLLTAAGEALGSLFSSPCGTILSGSPNTFINGRPAARVEKSLGRCGKHPGQVLVAEGSSNVFINGQPAARKGDKLTCGAVITSGSHNVFIGGGTRRYLPVEDEVPDWMRTGVNLLMAVAGAAAGLASVLKTAAQAGLKAAMPCAMKFTAGFVAGEVAARYVVEPVARKALGGLVGNPVDLTTGRKLLEDEHDFSLPGLLPIEWTRFYASDLQVDSVLGRGWMLPWEQSLRRDGDLLLLTDNQGREVPFVTLDPGQRLYNPNEQIYLVRSEGGHYLLETLDNLFFYFGEVPEDGSRAPLQRIENIHGHFLHLSRDKDGVLTDLHATGGLRVHLHYDDPLGRLTDVRRVVDNQSVETLVRYLYDPQGQLCAVVNRNGDTVRRFSYEDGLMVTQRNALGLECSYRWETLGGQPRVVEHWTSDHEHFHFRYDLEARTSWATDALDRELEIHYNPDHRVIASRDFGGERYAIELDSLGNLLGLPLPGERQLSFKYDEFARLVEETDPLGRSTRYDYHYFSTRVTQVDYPDGSVWRAVYDNKGNLITEIDPLGHKTQYFHNDDGLLHTITDATGQSRHLWSNAFGQVERYQDCSGKDTRYRYNERQQLEAVTNALNQTTTLERSPVGEVLRIGHPDGSSESFTYNGLGQILSHTDGKGQVTRLQRTSRGLPGTRQDPQGHWVRYHYDQALRLTALVNENTATYSFAYDASDRLVEEVRVDNLTRRFSYNDIGHLTRLDEIGYGEKGERPERSTHFEHDAVGRLRGKVNEDSRQTFEYDDGDRLLRIDRLPVRGPNVITEETLEYRYDLLGRLTEEITADGTLAYDYDPLGNLNTLALPDGRRLNHLYYGSGHLHQLNLDGKVISDFERDDLHREIHRTQGKLTSCFGYDAMGRKAWQYASTLPRRMLSNVACPGFRFEVHLDKDGNPIHRRYRYDPAGELVSTLDKLRGELKYQYDAKGQLQRSDPSGYIGEGFLYDPAGNRLGLIDRTLDKLKDNRIGDWNYYHYRHDAWGNLIERRSHSSLNVLKLWYDGENRLILSQRWYDGNLQSQAEYRYDSLGRRVSKSVEYRGGTKQQKRFLWQGLRMLQEKTPEQNQLYLYEPGSYAPLARIDQKEGEEQNTYYFHTDQIGTPLEMTDSEGEIVWQGNYFCWGEPYPREMTNVEQNLRFQGQYFDDETGLHYNTFRYYEPKIGRFITQDPIGLEGGLNLYRYAPNPIGWVDPWGWECWSTARKNYWKAEAKSPTRIYSAENLARMNDGRAPNFTAEVISRRTDKIMVKEYTLELHHTDIPQRAGGAGVHASSNLRALTPWEHEAVDQFRHVGSDLIRIIRGVDGL